MKDDLAWLEEWYEEQCNGDWEHVHGITIGTLDNPGWTFEIDLVETPLSEVILEPVFVERSEHDWISYEVANGKFQGRGGPGSLRELLSVFRRLAERSG